MKTLARTTRCLLAVTALSVSYAFATPETVPQDDAGLADFIEMTFSADDRLTEEKIRVSIGEGIARLSGKVATIDQAERAVLRTLSTEGVRGVISHIRIAGPSEPDLALQEKIERRLKECPGLNAAGTVVSVSNGIATLEGRVATWDEQEIARELASEVPGVRAIDNRLDATQAAARSDAAIRWQVEHRISDDPLFDGLSLRVAVSEGRVTLTGEVGSRGEKDLLARLANVGGVQSISTRGVTVVRSLSMEGMTGKTPGPAAVREALAAVFRADDRLRGANYVKPELDGRLLYLDGNVEDLSAKFAAESTARGVAGVDIVINRITVGRDRHVASIPH